MRGAFSEYAIALIVAALATMKSRRRPDAQEDTTLQQSLIDAWRTNNRVTTYLVEHFPAPLWATPVPAASNRPVRMILGHLHNSRSRSLSPGKRKR